MYFFKNEVSIENRPIMEEYLNSFEYKTSGLSFSGLYMWRDSNQFAWEMIGEHLCISALSHLELEQGIELPFMFPPLTRTGTYDQDELRRTILEARRRFEAEGHPFCLRLVPFHMMEMIQAAVPEMKWTDDRPNYDYVYLTKDLIDLKGRDFHGKKNHLNYFKKTYEYEYVKMTSDMADEAMAFIGEFNARKKVPAHEMELLLMEEKAMEDVFRNIEAVGYSAGAIRIDGKIEAIAIGGRLGRNTVVEHVEKANVEYRGLYQAINNEFCKHVASWAKYINREEDMGIPNLRKAKLSYRPVKLLEKYIGCFK
ncbi:MAG: phosphatidylglycerol lysyltransferase domain-containing protein [Eubacteriales bacterium]|nr:phosphatidylglycerol lysyltransferase domain-containing protein [Eubacteriales bacterium]